MELADKVAEIQRILSLASDEHPQYDLETLTTWERKIDPTIFSVGAGNHLLSPNKIPASVR